MNELVVVLVLALVVALVAVVMLAFTLPRRVARMMLVERALGDARAMTAKASLHATSTAEVAVIVQPIRGLLEQQARHTYEAAQITSWLRSLVDWLATYADARYAQVVAEARAAPETKPKGERVADSRARQSPKVPVLAAPAPRPAMGSSPTLPSAQAPKLGARDDEPPSGGRAA